MRINFHGAAQTVTGSQHLLEINGHRLLLDCGLYQGRREESYARNLKFPYDPRSVDAVILSHAHIDHSGNLPNLVQDGYQGRIYAVPATVDLAKIMLADSGRIQESDAEFVNRKRLERGEAPIEPLYIEAGHILGSAAILLDIEEKGRKISFWFSGDIGRYKLPLLRDPVLPQDVD